MARNHQARLQPYWVSRYETARRTIGGLPTWCPATGVIIVGRCIESQPGNDGESVTLTCIDGDPFATAAATVFAELSRAHRRTDQPRCAEHIRDRAGTIVTAAIAIRLRAKLICGPNCSLYRYRRFFRRSCLTSRANARLFTYDNWSRRRKNVGDCQWNNQHKNSRAQQNFTVNRIYKFLRGCVVCQKTGGWKE
jgi:hypothetical protein